MAVDLGGGAMLGRGGRGTAAGVSSSGAKRGAKMIEDRAGIDGLTWRLVVPVLDYDLRVLKFCRHGGGGLLIGLDWGDHRGNSGYSIMIRCFLLINNALYI